MKTITDRQLKSLLTDIDQPRKDDGFTQSVVGNLPRKRRPTLLKRLLLLATVFALLPVAWLFPFEQLSIVSLQSTLSPWVFILLLLPLSTMVSITSWTYARSKFRS